MTSVNVAPYCWICLETNHLTTQCLSIVVAALWNANKNVQSQFFIDIETPAMVLSQHLPRMLIEETLHTEGAEIGECLKRATTIGMTPEPTAELISLQAPLQRNCQRNTRRKRQQDGTFCSIPSSTLSSRIKQDSKRLSNLAEHA